MDLLSRASVPSSPLLGEARAVTTQGIEGPLVSLPVVSRHGVFFWLFSTLVTVRFTFLLVTVLMAGLSLGRSCSRELTRG
jgi:hypothetical protein